MNSFSPFSIVYNLYAKVMYREGTEGKDEAYLKLYDGHDWRWFRVCLSHTDMEYLRRNWYGKKASAPALEKRHHMGKYSVEQIQMVLLVH